LEVIEILINPPKSPFSPARSMGGKKGDLQGISSLFVHALFTPTLGLTVKICVSKLNFQ